jgi:hypothetical protein
MNLHSSNESNGDSNGGGGGCEVIATTTITTGENQHEAASSSSNKMNRNELAKYEIRMFVLFMIRLVFFYTVILSIPALTRI